MKRGRPNARNRVTSSIIAALESTQTPLTTSSLKKIVSGELKQNFSWNTIQKYINELVQTNKLNTIQLPHSKTANKTGLTVYSLKK